MAAAPAFQHNPAEAAHCYRCHQALDGFLARHICPSCGYPQPLDGNRDFFGALGAPVRFGQNRDALEKRFYEISRALHPDRFTTAGPEARRHSLERMSFLNEAYGALKDPASLREYLLQREGVKIEAKGSQIPVELAESWFELQDSLTEHPDSARSRLAQFEGELKALHEKNLLNIQALERAIDEAAAGEHPPRAELERLAREIQAQSYILSMERDVARLKSRMTSE